MAYITGLTGTGAAGYFTSAGGVPVFGLADNPWGLLPNAGRWSGTWQSTLDAYFGSRGAQGFAVAYVDPYGNVINGCVNDDGRTWDGVLPFTGGDPGQLNDVFFARVDYMIAAAAGAGMTVFMNIGYNTDMGAGGCLNGKTGTQYTNYGAALAARYAAVPNIVWVVGNDVGDTYATEYGQIKTGLRNGGDTHVFTEHNYPETTSRRELDTGTVMVSGSALAEVNFVYTYNCSYFGIEEAYKEASPLPVVYGDGYFYAGGTSNVYDATQDRAARQEVWWAVASGARFYNFGSEAIWDWPSTAAAATTSQYFYTTQAGKIRSALEGLTNWHKLIPDTGNALVTAGRGTRCTSLAGGGGAPTPYEPSTANNWVAASRVADGSLALIYLPVAATITIDQAQMASGWQAKWIDPVSCAVYAGTKGGTFNSGATDGSKPANNSAGQADWVLVLAQPPYATWTVP